MDTNTLIALTVLTDHLKRQQALIHETLDLLERIPKVPDDIDPPCRMTPVTATDQTETGSASSVFPDVTFEQVRKLFTDKSSRGMKAEMKSILTAHALQKLSDAKENRQLLNLLAAEAKATGNAALTEHNIMLSRVSP